MNININIINININIININMNFYFIFFIITSVRLWSTMSSIASRGPDRRHSRHAGQCTARLCPHAPLVSTQKFRCPAEPERQRPQKSHVAADARTETGARQCRRDASKRKNADATAHRNAHSKGHGCKRRGRSPREHRA